MIARISFFVIVGAATLLLACTPKNTMPSIASTGSGPWLAKAAHIKTGAYDIYFYGTATPAAAPAGTAWSGSITGDIYLITPAQRMMIPKGTLNISPAGAISTAGQSISTVR